MVWIGSQLAQNNRVCFPRWLLSSKCCLEMTGGVTVNTDNKYHNEQLNLPRFNSGIMAKVSITTVGEITHLNTESCNVLPVSF